MTPANIQANVEAELSRARDSLRAAAVLIQAGLLHDAESRLYYAIYHGAVALLLTEGIEPRSHAGTSALLGQHFVRSRRLDPSDARLFARIQKYRLEADYGRDFVLTSDALQEDFDACAGFLHRVTELIENESRPAS